MIDDRYVEDFKWWKDKLHNYKELDSLSDKEARRLAFCCLEFIMTHVQHENNSVNSFDKLKL